MPVKKKTKIIWSVVAGAFIALIIWIIWGNTALEMNTYTVQNEKLPNAFSGYRIAHISDLHNAQMGENNEKLLQMLRNAQPDMIAITGDLIDSYHTDIDVSLEFAAKAVEIAPCYYVPGNHEGRIAQYDHLKEGLKALGVVVLENQCVTVEKGSDMIHLLGVIDPSFQTDYLLGDEKTAMEAHLQNFEYEGFAILLSHRPEMMDIYARKGVDLVLSGHAHGGQFRLPFVGGLVAPDQGFFPEYDGGLYRQDDTTMIVSRGIGNSIFPFRFNNRPEVILIELISG